MARRLVLLTCLPFLFAYGECASPAFKTAPADQGIPKAPTDSAPTGTRWVDTPVDGGCGRTTLAWLLVDETCGGTERADYFDAFTAPMFRDGVKVNDNLYVADATHVWVIDASNPGDLQRRGMVAG